jgi:hypothetical protein
VSREGSFASASCCGPQQGASLQWLDPSSRQTSRLSGSRSAAALVLFVGILLLSTPSGVSPVVVLQAELSASPSIWRRRLMKDSIVFRFHLRGPCKSLVVIFFIEWTCL